MGAGKAGVLRRARTYQLNVLDLLTSSTWEIKIDPLLENSLNQLAQNGRASKLEPAEDMTSRPRGSSPRSVLTEPVST